MPTPAKPGPPQSYVSLVFLEVSMSSWTNHSAVSTDLSPIGRLLVLLSRTIALGSRGAFEMPKSPFRKGLAPPTVTRSLRGAVFSGFGSPL